ncbi:MAG: AAA family ATPase, partial [Candidatus Bathyarchaeia archaeon]
MTAAESEDYVTCPSCRTLVPWTPSCIYCGSSLPPKRREPRRRRPSSMPELSLEGLGVTDISVEPEGRLTNYILWRVRLMELLRAGRVSQEVFEQLYKEYISETRDALERKRAFMREYDDVRLQMQDVKRKLSDLDRRRASGQRTTGEYLDEYSRLKSIQEQLQADLSRIRFQQRSLGLVLSEGRDAEILGAIEKRFRNYLSYLPLMTSNGLLSPTMEGVVREDLEMMLGLMEEAAKEEAVDVLAEEAEEAAAEELPFDDEALLRDISAVVKGHDDEIRRIIRAIRMKDNVLVLGPHGEGKTELLLQLNKRLGGIYFHCNEEVSERELVAGFNPSAFVGRNPIHLGCLMQIATGEAKGAPIAFIDAVMKLRPKTQVILFEAMNNKSFTNPVDGKFYFLPEGFSVVSASNLESVTQETPDAAFL